MEARKQGRKALQSPEKEMTVVLTPILEVKIRKVN